MGLFGNALPFLKEGLKPEALLTGGLAAVPAQSKMLKEDFSRGGGGGGSTPAGDAYAALTRDMWDSYVQNFMPYENRLIEFATDQDAPADAMARAGQLVNQSFDQQQAASQRRLRGLGLTLDADEQQAADRSWGIAKSLADVTAQNNARDLVRSRQQSVLGNPVPTLPQI